MNPAVHLWSEWINETQEFACDEALLKRPKVDAIRYANCLYEVARGAMNSNSFVAVNLNYLVSKKILNRRVQAVLDRNTTVKSSAAFLPLLLISTLFLGFTAYATQGSVQDKRISMAQAQKLVKGDAKPNGFPLVVNDLVLKQLNNYVGTSQGREKMKSALARMEKFKGPIEAKLAEYHMPIEFLALPLVESGYRNLDAKENKTSGAAGLWQFIASTAQNFGLRVDDKVDERLSVEQETDAALRLLLANKLMFKDWQLSVLAYNAGEKSVQLAIDKTRSRNAWELIRSHPSGTLNSENSNYLPKLVAAMVILRNPSIAD